MRPAYTIALASAAALALGAAGAWAAGNSHVLKIRLPDGTQAQIRYFGSTPPKVSFEAAPFAPAFASGAFAGPASFAYPWAVNGPFAELDRMSAAMDRQAAQETAWMLSHAPISPLTTASTAPGGTMRVAFGALPAGVTGYSVVSTTRGGKTCTRTTEYMAPVKGEAQKVVTRTSGCEGAAAAAPSSVAPAASMNQHAAGITQASYVTAP